MKLNITCKGHPARLDLDAVGPALVGTITSAEFGTGRVQATRDGDAIGGSVHLDGREATFTASISGSSVTGEIKYGWFFREPFTGTVYE